MKIVKEKIDTGIIEIKYKSTKEMSADILTKPVTKKQSKFAIANNGHKQSNFALLGSQVKLRK